MKLIFINLILVFICFELIAQSTEQKMEERTVYNLKKIAEGAFSNPVYSPDGLNISFTGRTQDGIYIIDAEGNDIQILTKHIGAGYKYVYALDNDMIVYRGTMFQDTKRLQFIGVINLKERTDTILMIYKRLQPPVWKYTKEGKKIVYVVNDDVFETEAYPYTNNNTDDILNTAFLNTFFYYKEGGFYIVDDDSKNINENVKLDGMDPVFSPDRTKIIYAKGDSLYLYLLEKNDVVLLDNGRHPSWSPDSKSFVYQKTNDNGHIITSSDLYILETNTKQIKRLTYTDDIFESNPCWAKDGKSILFDDEKDGSIYVLTFE